MDIAPAARGHVLVITREHFETLYELSAEAAQGVALTARRVALALRSSPTGCLSSNRTVPPPTRPYPTIMCT